MATRNARWVAERTKKRIAEGLCTYCGERPPAIGPRGGGRLCGECNAKRKETSENYYTSVQGERKTKYKKQSEYRKANNICTECGKRPPIEGLKKCQECSDRMGRYKKENRSDSQNAENNRRKAIHIQSGGVCEKCGYDDIRILQFHHKNNDGKDDRKRFTSEKGNFSVRKFYAEIIKNGPRADIEILCPNCHRLGHWMEHRSDYNPDNWSMRIWLKERSSELS